MHASPADARASFAKALDDAVPPGAHALVSPGAVALAWSVGGGDGEFVELVFSADGSPAAAGVLMGVPAHEIGAAHLREVLNVQFPVGRAGPCGAGDGAPHPMRAAAIAALVEASDAEGVALMLDLGLTSPQVLGWLAAAGPLRGRVAAFARAHPWLAPIAADMASDLLRVLGDGGPDDVAASVAERLGAEGNGLSLVRRMRHFRLSDELVGVDESGRIPVLARFPPALFPPPLAEDASAEGDAQQGYLALFSLSGHVEGLARISGRAPASIVGRNEDWAAYATRLVERGGREEGPGQYPGEWGWILCEDVASDIAETIHHLAAEVIRPAAMLARPGAPPPPAGRARPCDLRDGTFLASAARLLLGERTLPALAEVAARWHVRSDPIARLLVEVAGAGAPYGPCLFDDVDLGDGHYMTSLHRARDLLDEGAPGPDRTGVRGLSHCVGGYGEAVAAGRTAIASLRRRTPSGFARLSTAEIDLTPMSQGLAPEVVQHRAWRNSDPGEAADALLARGLARVAGEAHRRLGAHKASAPPAFDWGEAVALSGRWEEVRDAWAFALPRPLRKAGPGEILSAAGRSG